MPEEPQGLRASEQQRLTPAEMQERRQSLQQSADEVQAELQRQQDYGNRVRQIITPLESAENISTENLSKIRVLRAELALTDDKIAQANTTLQRLQNEINQLDALLVQTERKELDIYTAEAPIYQSSPAEWSRLMARTNRAIGAYNNAKDYLAAHPQDAALTALVASVAGDVNEYGANLPQDPRSGGYKADPENHRRIGILLKMLTRLEPAVPELERLTGTVDGIRRINRTLVVPLQKIWLDIRPNFSQRSSMTALDPAASSYTSSTQGIQIQKTADGWSLTAAEGFTGAVYVNRTGSADGWTRFAFGQASAPQTPAEQPQVTQTPTPQRQVQTPSVQNARPSVPESPSPAPRAQTQPAEQDRITIRPGLTLPRLNNRRTQQTPPVTETPRTETSPPLAAPQTPGAPLQTETREMATERISLPAGQTCYVRVQGSNQYQYLQPSFADMSWTLGSYGVARRSADKQSWIITRQPGFSGVIETSLDRRVWAAGSLATAVPQMSASSAPATGPARTEVPAPQPPSVPVPQPERITIRPGLTLPRLNNQRTQQTPPATETPRTETTAPTPIPETRTLQSRSSVSGTETVRRPSDRPWENSLELERMFRPIYERYRATIVRDYAAKGGSTAWKVFDHRFSQLMFDLEEPFGGNTPLFLNGNEWRSLLSRGSHAREDKVQVYNALQGMTALLDEYEASVIPDEKPAEIQRIDTLNGDLNTLTREISALRSQIESKSDEKLKRRFRALDALYTEALGLARTDDVRRAVLVCHRTLAQNYASLDSLPGSNTSFLSNIMGSAQVLLASNDERAFRTSLIEQAESTPVELKLNAAQLLQLIKIKRGVDAVRARTDLTDQQRYDEVVGVIGKYSDVLQALQKESERQLSSTRAAGWKTEVAMKDVLNPDTIDWLIAAHVAPVPFTGISDRSFFYVEPLSGQRTEPSVASERRTEPDTAPTPALPEINLRSMLQMKPENASEPDGRTLSADEVIQLGFNVRSTETVKQIFDGSYIACTDTSCRPVRPRITEEAAPGTPITPEPSPTPIASPAPAETRSTAPEGIRVSPERREVRIPVSEPFSVSYSPNPGNVPASSFGPNSLTLDGIYVKVRTEGSDWVVKVKPEYEGTVTVTRTRDNATASLLASRTQPTVTAAPVAVSNAPRETQRANEVQYALTDGQFNEMVLQSPVPVILDLYADWCTPCKQMEPFLQEIARTHAGAVRVVKVNGESLTGIFNRYAPVDRDGQRKYPSIVIFNQGQVHESAIGYRTQSQIEQMLPPDGRIAGMR
jgi:thioredoxin 1